MLCLSMNWLSLIYAICFEHIHLYCSLKRQAVRRGTTARFLNPISKNQIQNACWAVPKPLAFCIRWMQAAHSCGTLLLRVNAHSLWKFRMLFGVSVNGAVLAFVVEWVRCVPDTRKREDGCRDGTALPDARWGTLHEISGRKRRTESSVYLLFAARQTVQLHLQNHGWSPAVVRGLARNTRSLLYKLKKTAENRP